MEKYTINEKLKRIEPTETLCQFCGIHHSENADQNYYAPLFNIENRTNIIVYRSVKFKEIKVGIPRCNNCCQIHKRCNLYAGIIGGLTSLILIILGCKYAGILALVTSILSILPGVLLYMFIGNVLIRKHGILTYNEAKDENPLIQEFVYDGWSTKPPIN